MCAVKPQNLLKKDMKDGETRLRTKAYGNHLFCKNA